MRLNYNDIKWAIVLAILTALVMAYGMTGCKTCIPIVETRDSVRVEFKHDSVYVYKHDSIFRDRWRNGDTVYITTDRWRTLYKDKIVEIHDTIRTDTNTVQEVKVVPQFYKTCTVIMWIMSVALILYIAARIVIKIYFGR